MIVEIYLENKKKTEKSDLRKIYIAHGFILIHRADSNYFVNFYMCKTKEFHFSKPEDKIEIFDIFKMDDGLYHYVKYSDLLGTKKFLDKKENYIEAGRYFSI